MIPENVEKFPIICGHPDFNNQLDRLWDLIWDLGGGSAYSRSNDGTAFEALVQWWCRDQTFSIWNIKGNLPTAYKVKDVAGTIDLTLENRRYQFSANLNYGSFKTSSDSIYLTSGSAYYSDRWEDEPVEDFIQAPFTNFNGRIRDKWLMTSSVANEAISFLTDLCDRIEKVCK